MRATHPKIMSKTALTLFVTENFSPVIAGIIMGTLLVTVIGSGAGLALGVVKCIKNDILVNVRKFNKFSEEKNIEKFLIVAVLMLGCVMSMGGFGDTILNFAFMSMGLRGATLFAPLCFAIFCPGRVSAKYAMVSIITGPAIVLLFYLVDITQYYVSFFETVNVVLH
jgi:SSS family solute:Na+ symporter